MLKKPFIVIGSLVLSIIIMVAYRELYLPYKTATTQVIHPVYESDQDLAYKDFPREVEFSYNFPEKAKILYEGTNYYTLEKTTVKASFLEGIFLKKDKKVQFNIVALEKTKGGYRTLNNKKDIFYLPEEKGYTGLINISNNTGIFMVNFNDWEEYHFFSEQNKLISWSNAVKQLQTK
jgi:hypothetical protein